MRGTERCAWSVLAIALSGAVGAAGWFFFAGPAATWRGADAPPSPRPTEYVPLVRTDGKAGDAAWKAPMAQPRGPAWVFELFTPPELRYDATAKRWSVSRPSPEGEYTTDAASFAAESASEEHVPFRLKLLGHVANNERALGVFENVETGETFLAGSGADLPALGLTIVSFVVERERWSAPESTPVWQRVGTAVVRDERAGEWVTLSDRRTQGAKSVVADASAPREVAAAAKRHTGAESSSELPTRDALGRVSPGIEQTALSSFTP